MADIFKFPSASQANHEIFGGPAPVDIDMNITNIPENKDNKSAENDKKEQPADNTNKQVESKKEISNDNQKDTQKQAQAEQTSNSKDSNNKPEQVNTKQQKTEQSQPVKDSNNQQQNNIPEKKEQSQKPEEDKSKQGNNQAVAEPENQFKELSVKSLKELGFETSDNKKFVRKIKNFDVQIELP